ncbi:sensor histidine kinase [Actinomyces slackii]|uniref:sensor histidine kinase n=1 Tax=Actinomyces slackii TaxID=52774 RepID=UPI00047EFB74|nr:histidine kinase [Actinomyces slackii]
MTGLLAPTRLTVWTPRLRTHLLCLACATLLTLAAVAALVPDRRTDAFYMVTLLISGLGVAVLSVAPLISSGLCLGTLYAFLLALGDAAPAGPSLPAIGPWLCASVLLTRGFSRLSAYGLVLISLGGSVIGHHSNVVSNSALATDFTYTMLVGTICLIVAELMRQPRMEAEAAARRHEADMRNQRLLIVSELHDTVVRDLTQAVMRAEQARLAQPDAPLVGELGAMTSSVRTAVDQLRSSLRSMNDMADQVPLDVLASSAPRSLTEVVDETRRTLAARGISLETAGLEALESARIGPGLRQQLVRMLGELTTNMAKHAAPGPARLVVEHDGMSLEAMSSNTVDAGTEADPVASSGLGLVGVRRRVEALGGTLNVSRTPDRFTVVLSVPVV